MKEIFDKKRNRGIGLIEIIAGTAIISLSLIGIVVAFNLQFRAGLQNTEKIQAAYLLEEGIEVMLFFRNDNWDTNIATLAVDTTQYLFFNGLFWETTTDQPAFTDGLFDREVVLADVYRRNSDDDIVPAATPDSRLDPDIKQLTITVAWKPRGESTAATTTAQVQTYLVKIF